MTAKGLGLMAKSQSPQMRCDIGVTSARLPVTSCEPSPLAFSL
jgi:hypothetical protein